MSTATADAPADRELLSRATLAAYAIPALGPSVLYNLVVVMYLNFATDQLN